MGHDIREAKGSEKKRSGFELTAAECSKSALVVRVNEHELELPTVVQVINNNSDVIQYVVLKVHFLYTAQWLSWLERRPVTAKVVGSSPIWVVWGLSSAGRASALQAEGHRFEPYRPHLHIAACGRKSAINVVVKLSSRCMHFIIASAGVAE